MGEEIAVIGSANMDIGGYSHGPLTTRGDSNPGRRAPVRRRRGLQYRPQSGAARGRACAF